MLAVYTLEGPVFLFFMNTGNHFNIRVYGLLVNEHNEVLLTDEYRMGTYMTKFPGGGLEYGEGTIDCLKREFKEELAIEVEIQSHFYTTDYFQKAMFFEGMQLISIYYRVTFPDTKSICTSSEKNAIPAEEGAQSFRWVAIKDISKADFTFPIDKKVAELLSLKLTT